MIAKLYTGSAKKDKAVFSIASRGASTSKAAAASTAFGPRNLAFPPGVVYTVEDMNELKPKVGGRIRFAACGGK